VAFAETADTGAKTIAAEDILARMARFRSIAFQIVRAMGRVGEVFNPHMANRPTKHEDNSAVRLA